MTLYILSSSYYDAVTAICATKCLLLTKSAINRVTAIDVRRNRAKKDKFAVGSGEALDGCVPRIKAFVG